MVALHYRHLQDVSVLSICREPRFSALTTVLIAHGTVHFSFLLIRKETSRCVSTCNLQISVCNSWSSSSEPARLVHLEFLQMKFFVY